MNTSGCQGQNRYGEPCRATPQTGKPWCAFHDPALAQRRREWNRAAGRGKSTRNRATKLLRQSIMGFDDIDGLLCLTMRRVLGGQVEPGVASAVATLARALMQIRTAAEVEQRLAELEARAGIVVEDVG